MGDIICTGNLTNKNGLTLAQDMANYLANYCYSPIYIAKSILIAEEESCHTGHQIRAMRDFILTNRYDLLIPVSNRWHLKRITRQMEYWYKDIPILPIAHRLQLAQSHRALKTPSKKRFYMD